MREALFGFTNFFVSILLVRTKSLFSVFSLLFQPKLKNAVKGACGQIVKQGGLIKQIENHGHRQLPEVMRAHHQDHKYGQ